MIGGTVLADTILGLRTSPQYADIYYVIYVFSLLLWCMSEPDGCNRVTLLL